MLRRPIERLAILVAAFAGLAVLVGSGATDGIDDAILGLLLTWRSPALDQLFGLVTLAGDPIVSTLLVLPVAVVAVSRDGRPSPLSLRFLALFIAGMALEYALKQVVFQPGPPSELGRDSALLPALRYLSPYTFPSGHVMRVTFLAAVLGAGDARLRVAGAIAVALVAVGRLYLANGWAADVTGGLIAGLALATVAELIGTLVVSPRRASALAT